MRQIVIWVTEFSGVRTCSLPRAFESNYLPFINFDQYTTTFAAGLNEDDNMAAGSVLPTYQRYVNGVPVPQGRKTLRLREKYIILLVFLTFGIVCFGAFFFLPDLRDRVTMDEMRKHIQEAGNVIFFPQAELGADGHPLGGAKVLRHGDMIDPHKIVDKAELRKKIDVAWEQQKLNEVLGDKLNMKPEDAQVMKDKVQEEKNIILMKKKEEENLAKQEEMKKQLEVEKEHGGHALPDEAAGGSHDDEENRMRREKVKEVGFCNMCLNNSYIDIDYVELAIFNPNSNTYYKEGLCTGILGEDMVLNNIHLMPEMMLNDINHCFF